MLQCLTGKPEILNAVSMLSAGGFDLRGQTAKYASGRAIDWQQWLASKTAQGRQPPLTSVGIGSNLRPKA